MIRSTGKKIKKLEMEHKHIMRLIVRDRDKEGWVAVSDQLYPPLSANMPPELVTFDGSPGSYRAKLTIQGQNVLDAMKWI